MLTHRAERHISHLFRPAPAHVPGFALLPCTRAVPVNMVRSIWRLWPFVLFAFSRSVCRRGTAGRRRLCSSRRGAEKRTECVTGRTSDSVAQRLLVLARRAGFVP